MIGIDGNESKTNIIFFFSFELGKLIVLQSSICSIKFRGETSSNSGPGTTDRDDSFIQPDRYPIRLDFPESDYF